MDWNALSQQFRTQADLFITQINPNIITLYFKPLELTATSPLTNEIPHSLDLIGGRLPSDAIEGRMLEATGAYHEQPISIPISGRVYWTLKPSDPDLMNLNIQNMGDVCKVITYNENTPMINNSNTALIDGYNCKLIRRPLPHGLFGNQYCTSIWEIIL